jgi:chorismate synthase
MNTFGRILRISLFGESHGGAVGCTLDGVPPGIPLSEADLLPDLQRRKSGKVGTTPRQEPDQPRIVTGVFQGHTTGAPLTVLFENTNTRSRDYRQFVESPRPGHADFVAQRKYGGFQDYTGGGHFSGRVTLGVVAAGAIAKKILGPATISSEVLEIGGQKDYEEILAAAVEAHDSLGGIIQLRVDGLPVGLGEPFFDAVEACLAHAVFAVPATRGIEFGTGFPAARMKGSEHNDPIVDEQGTTATNHAGGINGGITNGNPVIFRVAVKPTSSIGRPQQTMNFAKGSVQEMLVEGRHDACIALRIPPVLEAVTALVLADLKLVAKGTAPVAISEE